MADSNTVVVSVRQEVRDYIKRQVEVLVEPVLEKLQETEQQLAEAQAGAAALRAVLERLSNWPHGGNSADTECMREFASTALATSAGAEFLTLARELFSLVDDDERLCAKTIYCPWCDQPMIFNRPNGGHAEDCRMVAARERGKAAGLLPREG